ncbi:MAG: tRNA (N(6)-L-threonylcarbamoyladenosine(37)-C(2))-methylthiotransferase MtaB [Clostridia bacterium]|nr:tRNA (N(6)-L-threonylcarbamoyladenosine(37)-C(2))-methylthiotransferase MtaB [Clostridia bacterium]
MPSIAFHTLGCKVNQYDTQAMLELFREGGYRIVPFSGEEHADFYLINTCTVTGTGDKKSMQLIRHVHRLHPDARLIVCGCLAQRAGEELLQEGGVQLVLGTQRRQDVVTLLEESLSESRALCAVQPLGAGASFESLAVSGQDEHTRATMKIQEGCGNRCTYCIIPSVRGPIRSRPLDEIVRETQRLTGEGFHEIVLTGIHLASYGRDFTGEESGLRLLDAIRAVHENRDVWRIRLGSLEPTVASAEFASALSQLPKVCPQFHLALQSGSSSVLRRMRRTYNADQYLRAFHNLKDVFPLAAFTSDILTGFPGETEEEFEETRQMIRTVGFARIHVFPFSPRVGTPAATMPGQLSRREKERRCGILIQDGLVTAGEYREQWIGKTSSVLVEEEKAEGNVKEMHGYTPEYIPVTVTMPVSCPSMQGKLLPVRLTSLLEDGMTGELAPEES